MLKIVTFMWDAGVHPKKNLTFETRHVEILNEMLKRNLQIPFELICITDKPIKFCHLKNDFTILSIWSWGNAYPGCYRRLKLFDPEMKRFIGDRFVMMDLDVIITGDITSLFQRKEDFVIWGGRPMRNPYCGSLMMHTAGTRRHIWDSFDINDYPVNVNGRNPLGTDQQHIRKVAPDEAIWTKADGVYNFGFDIRINDKIMRAGSARRSGLRGMDYYNHAIKNPKVRGGNGALPADAKLIFFNGKDDPSQSHLQEKYPWIKEYWR